MGQWTCHLMWQVSLEEAKMLKQIHNETEVMKHRVITMLDRHELEYLDKLGKDSLFSTGHKLSYSEILKWLVDFAMETGLTGENVNSKEKLIETIIRKIALANPNNQKKNE